jgi:hypothetical protein
MILMWPICSTPNSACAFWDSSFIFFTIAVPFGSNFAPGFIGCVLFVGIIAISFLGYVVGRS